MKKFRALIRDLGERGSTVGFVIIVPSVIMILGLGIFVGRVAIAGNSVETAAVAAARDASLARSDATAAANAREAALRVLSQQGISCSTLDVGVDTSGFRAPLGQYGQVTVTVNCTAAFSTVAFVGIPGSKNFVSVGSSPVDQYRER